ncbi:hypothetical protein GGR57DRAFT_452136 [Xylariaceae sp. FL1272]|nr:hypothetical protein GGR57DRAFT_452136 [Xylariaceae sp. FL1272]
MDRTQHNCSYSTERSNASDRSNGRHTEVRRLLVEADDLRGGDNNINLDVDEDDNDEDKDDRRKGNDDTRGGRSNNHGDGGDSTRIIAGQTTDLTTSTLSTVSSSTLRLWKTTTSSFSQTTTSRIPQATSTSTAIIIPITSTIPSHISAPSSTCPPRFFCHPDLSFLTSTSHTPSALLQLTTASFSIATLPAAATTATDDRGQNGHNDHKNHKSTSSDSPNTVTIVIVALAAIAFFTICATILYYRRRARLTQRLSNRQSVFRKAELDAVDTAVGSHSGAPHEVYVVRLGYDYPAELEAVRMRAELPGSLGKRRTSCRFL